jgi:hypothetical protein
LVVVWKKIFLPHFSFLNGPVLSLDLCEGQMGDYLLLLVFAVLFLVLP